MQDHLIALNTVGWQCSGPGVREKRLSLGARTVRLLELESEYVHPGWCETGHTGFVLSGAMRLEFEASDVMVAAGDGFCVQSGPSEKHRPVVVEAPVTLLLMEESADTAS